MELVRAGRTPGELAREFKCSAQAVRNWVRQADRDEGRREDGLTSAEPEELRRLRRENCQLREEREILKNRATPDPGLFPGVRRRAAFAVSATTVPSPPSAGSTSPRHRPGGPEQGGSLPTFSVASG